MSGFDKVGVPNSEYESASLYWKRARAVIGGQEAAKQYDLSVGPVVSGKERPLLVPFGPRMESRQWNQYIMEAELPGFCAQFTQTLVGGLLRKPPSLDLPTEVPSSVRDWIINEFTADGSGLTAFLYDAVREEITTGWTWITVDFPNIDTSQMTIDEASRIRPFPVMWPAERVINWRFSPHPSTGLQSLTLLVLSFVEDVYDEGDKFHPVKRRVVMVHDLDEDGYYRVTRFVSKEDANVSMTFGREVPGSEISSSFSGEEDFVMDGDPFYPLVYGEPMSYIPAVELSGKHKPPTPPLQALIDREISLYNKMSRRNHLMYGAATYTPYISGDISDDEFSEIISNGLGVWLRLGRDAQVGILEPPVSVLSYMNDSISRTVDEMARMGMRILAPEMSQSGIALEIRNSAQTAQLASMNTLVSESMRSVISWMIRWRYGFEINPDDIGFSLSSDFRPTARGYEWVSMVADLYRSGLVPRNVFLEVARANDILPPNYDDNESIQDINNDPITASNVDDQAKISSSETVSDQALTGGNNG